jgi:hypothetical protein
LSDHHHPTRTKPNGKLPEPDSATRTASPVPAGDNASKAIAACIERFKAASLKHVEGIIESGLALIALQEAVGRGIWEAYKEDLASKRVACKRQVEMLQRIASKPALTDPHNHADLPASVTKLYLLSGLADDKVQPLIDDGSIHPAITIEEVKELVERIGGPSADDEKLAEKCAELLQHLAHGIDLYKELKDVDLDRLIRSAEVDSELATLVVDRELVREYGRSWIAKAVFNQLAKLAQADEEDRAEAMR